MEKIAGLSFETRTQDLGLWTFPRRRVAAKPSEYDDNGVALEESPGEARKRAGPGRPMSRPMVTVTKAEWCGQEDDGEMRRSKNAGERKHHRSWLESGDRKREEGLRGDCDISRPGVWFH